MIFFHRLDVCQLELNEMIYGALRLNEIYEQYFITRLCSQVHSERISRIEIKADKNYGISVEHAVEV